MQSRNLNRSTPFAWGGTIATLLLMAWALAGLVSQDSELMQRCIAAGASQAECQLRIHGR